MTTCYIRSFYLVITTISTVGYGDISPVTPLETIYENAVVLTGACFFLRWHYWRILGVAISEGHTHGRLQCLQAQAPETRPVHGL